MKSNIINSQNTKVSYIKYHQNIIEAERLVFIEDDSIGGLKKFNETFCGYDFVFVDDCIEAFQLALVFNQDTFALKFIKKAIDNGFELHLLKLLNQGCLCNYFSKSINKITIFEPFINKYEGILSSYYKESNKKYVEKILKQKKVIYELYERHIIEQLYKQNEKKIIIKNGMAKTYQEISEQNIQFIDALFRNGDFIGDQNLGIYTDNLMKNLQLPFLTIKDMANSIIKKFQYNSSLIDVPFNTESDYFSPSPFFVILFHNKKSVEILTPYIQKAIDKGFFHPREYAFLLKNNDSTIKEYEKLGMNYFTTKPSNLKQINEKRKSMYLPPFEIDFYKHKFEHEKNVQLFFGFFNQSK